MCSHILTYSSTAPGTAGSVILPSASARRRNRRAIASRRIDGSKDLGGGSSTRPFYTTKLAQHQRSPGGPAPRRTVWPEQTGVIPLVLRARRAGLDVQEGRCVHGSEAGTAFRRCAGALRPIRR